MSRILAPVSLLAATLLFAATLPFAWSFAGGLVNAFAEAAMIGGLADWFAVVALFRHPLGLPIPHTAILLKYRNRITQGIVDAVQNNWLAKETIMERLGGVRIVEPLLAQFDDAGNRRIVLKLAGDAARETLRTLDADALAAAALSQARASIATPDLLRWLQRSLQRAMAQGMHTSLAVRLAARADDWLGAERIRAMLADNLKKAADDYSQSPLRQAGRWLAEKTNMLNYDELAASLVSTLRAELHSFSIDESHPLREEFAQWTRAFVDGLPENDDLAAMVEAWRADFLDAEGTRGAAAALAGRLRDRMLADLASDESAILRYAEDAFTQWLARFRSDAAVLGLYEERVKDFIARLVETHHDEIGTIVRHNLEKLNDAQLVEQIEGRVGGDLQYIRINGAVVGGLVGAALFLLKRWLLG